MQLHTDMREPLMLTTNTLEWEAAPADGVWRKKLAREAAESGQATSLVRYAKGARFSRHTHPGGEEIFVLSGTFSDESGDYPAGTYLRNPAGTAHAPFSAPGCDLFVKLGHFSPGDNQALAISYERAGWQQGMDDQQQILPLHQFDQQITHLLKLAPNACWRPVIPAGGLEALVIEGSLCCADKTLPAHSWIRQPGGSRCEFTVVEEPALVLVKTGHLNE